MPLLTHHTISDLQDLSDALFDAFHASNLILQFVLYFSFDVLGSADPMVRAQPLEKYFLKLFPSLHTLFLSFE